MTNNSDELILLDFHRDASEFGAQVPIRFRIGEDDLFWSRDGPFARLFVWSFAAFGMASLRVVKNAGYSALDLDDYAQALLFKMTSDNRLLIYSTMVETTVSVDYESIFDAWVRFGDLVREAVVARHPEKESYGWWKLLTEDPPPTIVSELTRTYWFEEKKDCFPVD